MRALILLVLLAAPAFADAAATLPPVPDGKTRLVVIRESSFAAALSSLRVSANGNSLGSVGNGDAVAFDVTPGDLEIGLGNSLNWWGHLGAGLKTAAGETHYLHVWPRSMLAGRPAGEKGGALDDGHTICDGSWCVALIGEDEAMPLLNDVSVEGPKE